MDRSNECSSILKGVVAYVDVWSSNKTENYSKPFIDQLGEMGAEVSKTLNKHVTHVVFKDGHQGTWNKAKKIGAKVVSVLWLARCKDEAEFVDEELFPAQNVEGNKLLKKRTHRCMQPKDPAEKTPENDWRMKKKLDKMIKDLPLHSPLFPDVSPYIIDEEHGIVYSPSLKRSDGMARRLKEMREKRENLSPTASQMVEAAASSPGVKPRLGFSPFILKLLEDNSDEETSSAVTSPHRSPETRGESSRGADTSPHRAAEKPWLSPCSDVPKRKSLARFKTPTSAAAPPGALPLHTKSRRSSVKRKVRSGSEVPCQDPTAQLPQNPKTPKCIQSKLNFKCCVVKNRGYSPDDVKAKTKPVTSSEIRGTTSPGDSNPSSCPSAPAAARNTRVNLEAPKDVIFQLSKEDTPPPKRKRSSSSSALARKPSLPSESLGAAQRFPAAEEDDVFEDYFSPANHKRLQQRPSLLWLPEEDGVTLPFQLAPAPPSKRNPKRSEASAPERKRRPVGPRHSEDPSDRRWRDGGDGPAPGPAVAEPVPPSAAAGPTGGPARPPARAAGRQSPPLLPEMDMDDFVTRAVSRRVPSNPTKAARPGAAQAAASRRPREQSEGEVRPGAAESGGSGPTAAAGRAASASEEEGSCMRMEQSKATRTLVMTSMSTDKQQTVIQVVELLGGFSIVDRVCETTTHVASGGHRRTLNVLLGVARGCWILSFEWILRSLEQRRWLPEEPYELSEHFPAAPICRLQQHLSAGEHQQDLFLGQPGMFVSQQTQPPAHSLAELIQLCGGTVCKSVRQAGLCIGLYSGRRPEGSRNLSEQWVLDCITQLKLLSYENYSLE